MKIQNKLSKYVKLLKYKYIIMKYHNDWEKISSHKYLDEEFMRQHLDELEWDLLCVYQHLSEEFIRDNKDRVDWFWIMKRQKMSLSFIYEMAEELNFKNLSSSSLF